MQPLKFVAGAYLAFLSFAAITGSADDLIPGFIRAEHAEVLKRWLSRNISYRVATDEDCHCDTDLVETRTRTVGAWKAKPQYHPYYTTGDFNWDGISDFAVGVVIGKKPDTFRIAIFHGPFGPRHSSEPAFVSQPLRLGQGMDYGPPRPKPYMLLVGPFESEGALLRPTPKGYVWDEGGEE